MNASVYAYRRAHLMGDGRVIGDRSRVVEMDRLRSRDIDDEVDFAFIEFLVATKRVALPTVTA
jgi:CMP-N-acetylneuraminic acid synthetase